MTKVSTTVVKLLTDERDRLSSKAKRQGETAQSTLDDANALSKAIKDLEGS